MWRLEHQASPLEYLNPKMQTNWKVMIDKVFDYEDTRDEKRCQIVDRPTSLCDPSLSKVYCPPRTHLQKTPTRPLIK